MYQALWIVLLFDDETNKLVYDRNTSLETEHQPIDMWNWAIPHLTLAQVLMDDEQRQTYISWLESLHIEKFEIPTDGTHIDVGNSRYTRLKVVVTEILQSLHVSIMDKLVNSWFYTSIPQIIHFLCSDKVSQRALEWLQYFDQRYAYKNYDPHITIWRGRSDTPDLPVYISPRAIAIWRLWANGTVREIVYERSL